MAKIQKIFKSSKVKKLPFSYAKERTSYKLHLHNLLKKKLELNGSTGHIFRVFLGVFITNALLIL